MSEPRLISPLLDGFAAGSAYSSHHGVSCCPAMEKDFDDKYIIKIVSVPASQTQLDALLLTGAYTSLESALAYFREMADGVLEEVHILDGLSKLEGFLPCRGAQCEPKEDETGFDVYLLTPYRRTLTKQMDKHPMTQLDALNLGLDMCAALASCRRSGYLYVDLKPNNIFVTPEKNYFIGDLGFVRLDTLQYASMPEKYMSEYTAPEITDAFSSLNDTLDVYALGMVLYQVYNDGVLPTAQEDGSFPAPAYADAEMAEIIMKALDPRPQGRWQDPMQFGQALVGYMQRNGANDTPIVPPQPEEPDEAETPEQEDAETAQPEEVSDEVQEEQPESQADTAQDTPDEEAGIEPPEPEETESVSDIMEQLSFDEAIQDTDPADIPYEAVAEDVSDILAQADDLVEHPVPEPVVAPEPVEIPMPEPIVIPDETSADEVDPEDQPTDAEQSATDEDPESAQEDTEASEERAPKRKRHWLRGILIVLLCAALLAGAYYYYKNYYLQSVNTLTVHGEEDRLTVTVDTTVPEDSLYITCTDAHGNQVTSLVVDGVATFQELLPNTSYTVSVQSTGFYKLVGSTSTSYVTPMQTKIVQFNAVTGAEDGSVILSFTVEGPDSAVWSVTYGTNGTISEVATFPGHMVTLSGLDVGSEYTFTLVSESDLYLVGTVQIDHTASNLVYAQDLRITSCLDGKLCAQWACPADTQVSGWVVRCTGVDYSQSVTVTDTVAEFDVPDTTQAYDLEVIAAGMSVGQRASVAENAVTVSNVNIDASQVNALRLSWDSSKPVSTDGWIVHVLADDADIYAPLICADNSAVIENLVPGATYSVEISDPGDTDVLSAPITYSVPEAEPFSCEYEGKQTLGENITFRMCKTPSRSNWNRYSVRESDYKNTYSVGERASFVMHMEAPYGNSLQDYVITFVIRSADGTPVSAASKKTIWNNMWYRYYGQLDIPKLPSTPGEYTVSVYFNGMLANTQSFTMQ